MENENPMRASRLRPPTQIGSPGKGLSELNDSENNARAKPSFLPAPQVSGVKHRMTSAAEPDPKRKTLAERAGEPFRSVAGTPAPRNTFKGTSLQATGMRPPNTISRNPSFSSSVSSRSTSHGRTVSNGSYSSSVGAGSRQTSTSSYGRPQTSFALKKSQIKRPATAFDRHAEEEEEDDQPLQFGKRKGMTPISRVPSSNSSLHVSKARGKSPSKPTVRKVSNREISVTAKFRELKLYDNEKDDPFLDSPEKEANAQKMQVSAIQKSSITTAMRGLAIGDQSRDKSRNDISSPTRASISTGPMTTPSLIPKLKAEAKIATPAISPTRSISPVKTPFLTKDSNTTSFTAWDTDTRFADMESKFEDLKRHMQSSDGISHGLEEALALTRAKVVELEAIRAQLTSANGALQVELDSTKQRLSNTETVLEEERRANRIEKDDLKREHRIELEDLRRKLIDDTDALIRSHRDEIRELERCKNNQHEDERNALLKELQQLKSQVTEGNENTEVERQKKDREITRLQGELENLQERLEREKTQNKNMQTDMAESMTVRAKLEAQVKSYRDQIDFLESDSMSQSQRFEDMEARLQAALLSEKEAKEKLMKEESIRRSLFNQVQELKGNIRVMCRVRPTFGQEGPDDSAAISFPDSHKESKELEVLGPAEKSSLGKETRKLNAFSFDRVFGQTSQNEEIFEEISQLVQSALDGYNVCIFCYGQTGAGKTFTMSSSDGMIPRAVKQIYETATKLKEKNWEYKMEGSFIEVYNEDLHDLLGNPKDFDKKKHEIRHDNQRKQTTVTDLTTVELDSPNKVETILSKAMANRSVAATLSNERSSRSHSVFILKLLGHNTTTGEMSEGTLNLVDLAGSERLKQSGAEGARMKETQNINKSLSCLGDVIGALGNGKEGSHIPYRNSKLTYLLQFSLGGNSKTLMFVMISPLQAHLNETLTSLKFATKVHNTHIGTAKKSTKMRERSSDA